MTEEQTKDYIAALEREREGCEARKVIYMNTADRFGAVGDEIEKLRAVRAAEQQDGRLKDIGDEIKRVRGGENKSTRLRGEKTEKR